MKKSLILFVVLSLVLVVGSIQASKWYVGGGLKHYMFADDEQGVQILGGINLPFDNSEKFCAIAEAGFYNIMLDDDDARALRLSFLGKYSFTDQLNGLARVGMDFIIDPESDEQSRLGLGLEYLVNEKVSLSGEYLVYDEDTDFDAFNLGINYVINEKMDLRADYENGGSDNSSLELNLIFKF